MSAISEDDPVSRRSTLFGITTLVTPSLAFGASVPAGVGIRNADPNGPTYTLPPLGFDTAALEPYLSKSLVEQQVAIHSEYLKTLNDAFQGKPNPIAIAKLQKEVKGNIFGEMSPQLRAAVGGHYNRCLFFRSLAPEDDYGPIAALDKAIVTDFGGTDELDAALIKAAIAVAAVGGGWVWLGATPTTNRKIAVTYTVGEDNPVMDGSLFPFLAINVNKNAYEKQYGDDVKAYVTAFNVVINWRRVSADYLQFSADKSVIPCVEGDLLAAPPKSFR